jgi:2-oxoglutarate dehydrogenase E1 component
VLWEAQYGDFLNGAQEMLDQFVTSGRAKWGLAPSLVFLLPHGYEGQGPEHSNARPERILQAASDINLRLVNCTTAAQYFHLLRRQAALLELDPLPLFVLTPKSLLRHPFVASTPLELEQARFFSVLDDPEAARSPEAINRVVLCSGKVAVDLFTSEARRSAAGIAICRVEQLYPFPSVALGEVLDRYPSARDVVWLQEEPENMGAWEFMRPRLEELIGDRRPLRYIGRARNSSPSEGSAAWHQLNQTALVEQAFALGVGRPSPASSMVLSKQV